jgi:hypothetical protein
MTKVKVFVVKQGLPHSHEKLEFQINQFLAENDIEVVDIKYSTCSCSDTRGGGIWTPSAMLIYKTKE